MCFVCVCVGGGGGGKRVIALTPTFDNLPWQIADSL